MSFLGLLGQTITVYRQATSPVDGYGERTASWLSVWVGPGRAQPLAGDEDRRGRETVETRYRLFLPADCPIVHTDRVAVGTGPMLMVEVVQHWPGRDGSTHHIEAVLNQDVV